MRCEHFSGGEQVFYSPVVDLLRDGRRLYEQRGVCRPPRAGLGEVCMLTSMPCNAPYFDTACELLINVIGDSFIAHWNDAPNRTKAEVLAAFDRAIAMGF